jgi:hypothetical protein
MHEHLIPIIDEFLSQYVWDQKGFADDETFEQATEDERGGGDFMPITYYRAIVDPDDAARLLVSFSYGTNSLDHERQAPARVKQCMDALYAAHPEVAAVPVRVDANRF